MLDIGCGWGGLALYLAEIAGAKIGAIRMAQVHAAGRGEEE